MRRAALLAIALLPAMSWAQAPTGDPKAPKPSDPKSTPQSSDPQVDPPGDLGARALDDDDKPAEPADPGDDAQEPPEEPAEPKNDPLAIPDEIKDRIGVGDEAPRNGAIGSVTRRFRGYYEEERGDYRLRLIPPLYMEHTRGLAQRDEATGKSKEDVEGLYGLLYYRRRSLKLDADVVFPAVWRFREDQRQTLIAGPFVHQEAPADQEGRATHTNWLAPLVFEGIRKDGGYLHLPLLLTATNWREKSAFTWIGPYLRIRNEQSVDHGLFPFFLHGDNHHQDGARRSYTLIPPALFFQRYRELQNERLTIVGPYYHRTNNLRSITNVLPLVWHIEGKPETGGVRESHTTVFPLFHYGRSEEKSLLVTPGYVRRVTAEADTLITPLVSIASARHGRTQLIAAGPIVPLFYNYADQDTGLRWTGLFPLAMHLHSPRGTTLATPLFVTDRNYGVNRTNWVFPNLVWGTSTKGWHTEFYPIVFAGRSGESRHTVVAPLYWDFSSPKSRQTVGFPLFWRFTNTESRSVTQVVANTVYLERHVRGGQDWEFHFAPLFSYGRSPRGHFWNVLFGLAGYSRKGDDAYVRALWIPFQVDSAGNKKNVAHR